MDIPTVRNAIFSDRLEGGVSYAQAMEIFHRFFAGDRLQAVPSIAEEMGIPYPVCCDVLDGKYWPGAHAYWSALVLP